MSGNSGAWGLAMWRDGYNQIDGPEQEQGISLSGGDAVNAYLPTIPLGFLTEPPAGLGVPPVRSGDVAFAQRDGVVQFADYYEPRQITFQVDIPNVGCPGCSPLGQPEGYLLLDGISPGRAQTAHRDALNITGDLDVRIHLAMDDWTPAASSAPVSRWRTVGVDQRAFTTRINTSGTLALFWSIDGTNATVQSRASTAAPVIANGVDLWLRYTLDVDNGAGGHDVRFYTSTDGETWTQLGATVTTAGVTSVWAPAPGAAGPELAVGAYNDGGSERIAGKVFYVEVRRGIDGTVVASPDFVEEGAGTRVFDDAQSNVWRVVAPGVLAATPGPAPLSARQAVARLTQEWSRNCTGATLVLFTDCHNPDATDEEKIYNGPYAVHGRPRVAEVTWRRSDIGGATVLLRFDAADARLILPDDLTPGTFWDLDQVQSVLAISQNLASDPTLAGLTMTLNGATVDDSYPQSGGPSGPDGGPYFRRRIIAPNTTSPMAMALSGTGLAGDPVDPADVFSVAFWARKDIPGGPAPRLDWSWYNAAGTLISNHSGTAPSVGSTWQRVLQQNIVAPALAEFVQWRLVWTGTALADQVLDFGQVWINEGAASTAPDTMEVAGTLCAYPVITLFPELTAPIVVTYGNHQFTYTEDVPIGTVITIDTRWGRASDGFVDVTDNLEGDFDSPLAPGVHDITVQTGDLADTGFVNVVWQNAVVSG